MISVEDLAYWYFRLNGYLTIRNFVVHPDEGRNQETDVDLIAARFPFRAENLVRPMKDDRVIVWARNRILIVLAEAKASACAINGPWTNRARRNMQRVLMAVGAFPRDIVNDIAEKLYDVGRYNGAYHSASIVCLGSTESAEVTEGYPDVPQITWSHVTDFIYDRFKTYRNQKVSHPQWDQAGRLLWHVAVRSTSPAGFQRNLREHLPDASGALGLRDG
jgi:hypothetical protein